MGKDELQEKRLEYALRKQEDVMYTTMLMAFGILTVLIASLSLLVNNLISAQRLVALFIIGVILFGAGSLWRLRNDRAIKRVDEKLADITTFEEEGQRIS